MDQRGGRSAGESRTCRSRWQLPVSTRELARIQALGLTVCLICEQIPRLILSLIRGLIRSLPTVLALALAACEGVDPSQPESLPSLMPIPAPTPVPVPLPVPVPVPVPVPIPVAVPISPPLDDYSRPGLVVVGFVDVSPDDVVSPWLVTSRQFREESRPEIGGNGQVDLVRYRDDFPVSAHIDFYTERLDTCLIREQDGTAVMDVNDGPPPRISGGSSIVINTPAGPWFSYAGIGTGGEIVYAASRALPGALPAEATLSIPGDEFPTVAAYPLHEPEPVMRLLPEPGLLDAGHTEYTWLPGGGHDYVKIDFLAFNLRGQFQGFPLTCWVADDGAFNLDAAGRAHLDGVEFPVTVRYSRVHARVDYINGIVVHQSIEVAE